MSANSTPKRAQAHTSRSGTYKFQLLADHRSRGHTLAHPPEADRGFDRPWIECRRCRQGDYRRSVSSFPACISLLGEGSASIVSEEAVPVTLEQWIRTKALP